MVFLIEVIYINQSTIYPLSSNYYGPGQYNQYKKDIIISSNITLIIIIISIVIFLIFFLTYYQYQRNKHNKQRIMHNDHIEL